MKKGILIVAVCLLAGVMAFCLMRSRTIAHSRGNLLDSMPELTWVRTDLKLTDAQFAKVSELHVAYRPKCLEMCRRISDAHEKMEGMTREGRNLTPELEAAIREHAVIHAECQQAMLKHLYETAAVLDDKQAGRYLETMIPFALDFTPSGSGNLHSH
ncbi:MAG: Spy/CpxP family protein refolding chaperone [Luteolibacter sp.]